MDNVNNLVTTGCKHTFHQDCLRQWCYVVHTCPVCRHDIPITCASLMPEPEPVPPPVAEPMAEMNWDAMAMAANIQDEQAMEAIVTRIRNGDSSNLFGANLYGADLEGANLSGADLENVNLEGADLQGANLQHTFLLRANLQYADLTGANLQGANFTDANNVDEAIFGNNTGTPIGLPNNINLSGGKRKTRKTRRK